MQLNLADIWLFLMGFFLLCYAITDGSNLGVGIISLFSRDDKERGLMMGVVNNTWHGNQTWLVLIGGMLFGAFPVFFAILLSSLYIPILIMLLGLIVRGVSFEFREVSRSKDPWSVAFGFGSLIATLAQGLALGGLLGGLELEKGDYVGSVWAWLSPFSALVAVGVLLGYTMLGANYLIMRTEGELQQRSFRYSLITSIVTLPVSVAVHLWVIRTYPHVLHKWTRWPDLFYVSSFLLLTVVAFLMFLRSLQKRFEVAPLFWNAAIILFSFIGVSIALYPYMIPHVISPVITVHNAAASSGTLMFMLVVTAMLVPVIFVYTAYIYRVFSGKVTGEGYEEAE
jgi:cytochrome d ubiquinol oxidase subunit II